MNWFSNLKAGLKKTSNILVGGISKIFTHKKLNKITIEELEDLLLTTDMGIEAASQISLELSKQKFAKDVSTTEVREFLCSNIEEILTPISKPLLIGKERPYVIMVCGVNGNGKTTTIGKLATQFHNQGYKIAVAACDTFRAAAVEQLEIWVSSICEFISGQGDPASIAYKAYVEAKQKSADILLIDTAGRLHNNENLMNELQKCHRVLKKIDELAPHEIILILDATTGQNAYAQIAKFNAMLNLTGMIITKLDSTAKGGILIGIAKKYSLPIYAIGVGEKVEDLLPFNPKDFASAII